MPTPTVSQAWATIKDIVRILDETEQFGASASPNLDTMINDVIEGVEGRRASQIISIAQSFEGGIGGFLAPGVVESALLPAFQDLAEAIDVPEAGSSNLDEILNEVYDYMLEQSPVDTINSREMTYGSFSADSGNSAGSLNLYRLTKDHNDYSMEMVSPEAKEIVCIRDQGTVDKYAEEFQWRGEAFHSYLAWSGSNRRVPFRSVVESDTAQYLRNPTFSQFSGTAPTSGSPTVLTATDELSGWEVSTAANWEVLLDSPTPWRQATGDSLNYAVRIKDNDDITQTLGDKRNPALPAATPMFYQIAVYRESSCDGTLTVDWGGTSDDTTVSSLNNSAWNLITPSLDKTLYHENYIENNIDFKITLASRTTGTLVFDAILMSPMSYIDGAYLFAASGPTPPLVNDKWTATDSDGVSRAKIMYWLWRAGANVTPPNVSSGETITDPS